MLVPTDNTTTTTRGGGRFRQNSSSGSWSGRWWTSRGTSPRTRPSAPVQSSSPAASPVPHCWQTSWTALLHPTSFGTCFCTSVFLSDAICWRSLRCSWRLQWQMFRCARLTPTGRSCWCSTWHLEQRSCARTWLEKEQSCVIVRYLLRFFVTSGGKFRGNRRSRYSASNSCSCWPQQVKNLNIWSRPPTLELDRCLTASVHSKVSGGHKCLECLPASSSITQWMEETFDRIPCYLKYSVAAAFIRPSTQTVTHQPELPVRTGSASWKRWSCLACSLQTPDEEKEEKKSERKPFDRGHGEFKSDQSNLS